MEITLIEKTLTALKKRYQSSSSLTVQGTGGYLIETSSHFNKPNISSQVVSFFNEHNWAIPDDYKKFLEMHDGAVIFQDNYSQSGGLHLLGLDHIELVREEYNYLFSDRCYPIAMFNASVIFIDSNRLEEKSHYLYWQDCSDNISMNLKVSFEEWLDLFVVTQGSEFWLWPIFK